jgi:hypothetical protein
MTRVSSAAALGFALLVISALAAPATAGDRVPFKGTFDARSAQTPAPPFVRDEITGTGHATHLGQFELLISATVDPVTRTGSGTITFVAANGDTLTATFAGASRPSGTPGVILITEHAIITGGTGHFAGATGRFAVERLFEPATGAVTGSIQGTVSSTGANTR